MNELFLPFDSFICYSIIWLVFRRLFHLIGFYVSLLFIRRKYESKMKLADWGQEKLICSKLNSNTEQIRCKKFSLRMNWKQREISNFWSKNLRWGVSKIL